MKQGFVLGDNNSLCMTCSRNYKSSQIKEQWDGILACPRCYDYKHPDLDPIIAPVEDPNPTNANPRPSAANWTYVDEPGVSIWGGVMNNGRDYGTEWLWSEMEIGFDEQTFDDFR